jgi:hypothetical protein
MTFFIRISFGFLSLETDAQRIVAWRPVGVWLAQKYKLFLNLASTRPTL